METKAGFAAAEWMRQWMAMMEARRPDGLGGYDREGLELAVADLSAGEAPPEACPHEIGLLGEFASRLEIETPELFRRALENSARFRPAALEFAEAFRASQGSSLASPALRERRRRAMDALVQGVLDPLVDRIDQIEHAMEMRERRHARRHPRLPDPGLSRDESGALPEAEALGRELAERAARRAREELSPAALAAVRRFLADPEAGTASGAAAREGISSATMSRALRHLRAIASAELEGCQESILKPFRAALLDHIAS
jgi:hypothetical protein